MIANESFLYIKLNEGIFWLYSILLLMLKATLMRPGNIGQTAQIRVIFAPKSGTHEVIWF